MINTYQTSLAPPPVPPRATRSSPVLIPALAPSPGYSKFLIKILVVLVLVHMGLSLGGFIYLYHTGKKEKVPLSEAKAAFLSSEGSSHNAMARMVVKQPSVQTFAKDNKLSGVLPWNMDRSLRMNINYFHSSWLTVLQPGDYYVYSRVTFSKGNPRIALANIVKLRESETAEEKDVMKAYCSLESYSSGLCTASQGEVISLEAGNQLSVWVQDLTLVDYEEGATTFGMYKL